MDPYWGEHEVLETPLRPRSLHIPFPKRVPLVLPGSLHLTRKMAKLGTWPRQRHWDAMTSNRTKDLICHPCLMVSGRSEEKGGTRAPSPRGFPAHTGLTGDLGRAPERQALRAQASDTSERAGPGTGWVRCPPQDSHYCLNRPETSLQIPWTLELHQLSFRQTEHMMPAAAHHGALHPKHGIEGSQPHGHLQGRHGTSDRLVALIPRFRGPLRTCTSHGLR